MTEAEIAAAAVGGVAGLGAFGLWLRARVKSKVGLHNVGVLVERVCVEQLEKEERRVELPPHDNSQRRAATEQRYMRFAGQEKIPIPRDLSARVSNWFKSRGK